jgi:hypothetical protein
MSFDQFASSSGENTTPPPKSAAPPPVETDEDLFNFDELLGATKQKEALNKELDDVLEAVESARQDVAQSVSKGVVPAAPAPSAKPAAASTPQNAAQPAPLLKHVTPAAAPKSPADALAASASNAATVVHQKFSMSPVAAVMLAGIVLVNVTLMLFAWNSVQSVKQLVLDVSHDVADTTNELRAESTRRNRSTALESEPVFGALPEGYRTLEIAKQRMERGEHARARRMLYGLLSVVDRIEQPARAEVEAQASFMIADSYRLEADAGGTLEGSAR